MNAIEYKPFEICVAFEYHCDSCLCQKHISLFLSLDIFSLSQFCFMISHFHNFLLSWAMCRMHTLSIYVRLTDEYSTKYKDVLFFCGCAGGGNNDGRSVVHQPWKDSCFAVTSFVLVSLLNAWCSFAIFNIQMWLWSAKSLGTNIVVVNIVSRFIVRKCEWNYSMFGKTISSSNFLFHR